MSFFVLHHDLFLIHWSCCCCCSSSSSCSSSSHQSPSHFLFPFFLILILLFLLFSFFFFSIHQSSHLFLPPTVTLPPLDHFYMSFLWLPLASPSTSSANPPNVRFSFRLSFPLHFFSLIQSTQTHIVLLCYFYNCFLYSHRYWRPSSQITVCSALSMIQYNQWIIAWLNLPTTFQTQNLHSNLSPERRHVLTFVLVR